MRHDTRFVSPLRIPHVFAIFRDDALSSAAYPAQLRHVSLAAFVKGSTKSRTQGEKAMRVAAVLVLAGAVVVAHPGVYTAEAQATPQPNQKPTAKAGDTVPPPIAVDVVAVDPKANTITVREIAAVPAPPGKAVAVKLDVPPSATGQKLSDTKPGEQVAVTCETKPTVHKAAGVPLVLTDCLKVIKIDPKS
jgi:hypothetical protein